MLACVLVREREREARVAACDFGDCTHSCSRLISPDDASTNQAKRVLRRSSKCSAAAARSRGWRRTSGGACARLGTWRRGEQVERRGVKLVAKAVPTLQGSASSAGRGLLLRRCAAFAPRVGRCPPLLSRRVRCSARRRTVLGLSFSSGHDPSGYQHLLFELRTPHSGSLSVRGRGVELGRARAMCIAVAFSQK